MSFDQTDTSASQSPQDQPRLDTTLSSGESIDLRLQALDRYFSSTLTDLSKFVETRASVFLILLGAVVICADLAMKVRIDGGPVAVLSSGEFIAVLVLGLALVVLGTGTTMFQLQTVAGVEEKKIEEGVRFAGSVEAQGLEQ